MEIDREDLNKGSEIFISFIHKDRRIKMGHVIGEGCELDITLNNNTIFNDNNFMIEENRDDYEDKRRVPDNSEVLKEIMDSIKDGN